MTLVYFDCFAGAGGDMVVGSLLDAGADFEALCGHLHRLGAEGYNLRAEKVNRGGIVGTKFHVDLTCPHEHCHPHRRLPDILGMIDRAALPARAADRARRVFIRLGQAEAKVHNIPVDQVHFHEVGAVDSIMDVVGACVAMELLDVDRVLCSAIPLGSGTVQTDHGLLPVPAPATAELLVGARTCPGGVGETITPTAAAVLTTLAEGYGPAPEMDISSVGYGAGSRNEGPLPNLLRVVVGKPGENGGADSVVELSANIDDASGQVIGAAIARLLSGGCLDAWATPIYMKKSRPAWMLSALCSPGDVRAAEQIIFAETPTFGIRRRICARTKLVRRHETVETPYGPIRVKVGSLDGHVMTAAPEFDDCYAAAQAHHVSVRQAIQAAEQAYRLAQDSSGTQAGR